MTIRTRFAPSPTGTLHIGSARTALFAWAYARHCGGKFILRVEDTDRERSTQASIDAILQGMEWLGLEYDEGPIYQTERFDRYREVVDQLLEKGLAYRCYCSQERMTKLRETQLANKDIPRYDGCCRDANHPHRDGEKYVIRFRTPQTGTIAFTDLVKGRITVENAQLDDLVIVRSDGTPTYNFCVVVDDADMQITHVIRGDDHVNNTPRQIHLYQALGWSVPEFAHLPMILGQDGKKLSKRAGATNVMEYQTEGYLPEALLNYLIRLGWSHGDTEIFSREEIIRLFELKDLNHSAAALNPEKLRWLNQQYFKSHTASKIASVVQPFIEKVIGGSLPADAPSLESVVALYVDRAKTLEEMAQACQYFYQEVIAYDPIAIQKHITTRARSMLEALTSIFAGLSDWQKETIHASLVEVSERYHSKLGQLAQPVRIAVTGGTVSPPIDVTLSLLGKEKTLACLRTFLGYLVTGTPF